MDLKNTALLSAVEADILSLDTATALSREGDQP